MVNLTALIIVEGSRSLNEEIKKHPDGVGAYLARAKLYLERKVHGDGSFALRDCDQAILLDPESRDAHFLRCKALKACSMSSVRNLVFTLFYKMCCQTALTFLYKFMDLFPDECEPRRVADLQESLKRDIIAKRRSSPVRQRNGEVMFKFKQC